MGSEHSNQQNKLMKDVYIYIYTYNCLASQSGHGSFLGVLIFLGKTFRAICVVVNAFTKPWHFQTTDRGACSNDKFF